MNVTAICVPFFLQCLCLIIELLPWPVQDFKDMHNNHKAPPDPMHSWPKCLKCNEMQARIIIQYQLCCIMRVDASCQWCEVTHRSPPALSSSSTDEDVCLSLSPPQWCRNDALILSLGRRKAKPPPPPVWPSRAAIQWERNSTIHLHCTYLMKMMMMMIQLYFISTPLPAFLPIGLYIMTHFKSLLLSVHTYIATICYMHLVIQFGFHTWTLFFY